MGTRALSEAIVGAAMDFPFTAAIFPERAVPSREPADCFGQGRDVGIPPNCRTREHPRSTSRTTFVVRTISGDSSNPSVVRRCPLWQPGVWTSRTR